MEDRTVLIRDLSQPLARGKGWIKFLGIINIIGGAFTALSLIGLLWAWVPIWLGVLLLQSANAIERAQLAGDEAAMRLSLDKLRVYFIVQGVLFLVGIAVTVLFMFLFFGAIMAAISQRF